MTLDHVVYVGGMRTMNEKQNKERDYSLRLMEDEFLEWLDKCPNEWLRIAADKESNTYLFYRKNEEDN